MSIRADLGLRRGTFELDLSFSAPRGHVIALVGSNGAGKSTAMAAMAGLLPLERGELVVDDRVLERVATHTRLSAQARRIGMLFQTLALFESMTVLDNVAYGPRSRGVAKPSARAEGHVWLKQFGIDGLADRRPSQLSGGEAHRVALARALIGAPSLLLLDEPLTALDAETRVEALAVLQRTLREFAGVTVVVAHDLDDVATLADQVIVIEGGKRVQAGTPSELIANPATALVRAMVERRRPG